MRDGGRPSPPETLSKTDGAAALTSQRIKAHSTIIDGSEKTEMHVCVKRSRQRGLQLLGQDQDPTGYSARRMVKPV